MDGRPLSEAHRVWLEASYDVSAALGVGLSPRSRSSYRVLVVPGRLRVRPLPPPERAAGVRRGDMWARRC